MPLFGQSLTFLIFTIFAANLSGAEVDPKAETERVAELDAYWTEVSRAVNEGNFEAYEATCHPEAVLVSGKAKTSYPLAKALARWKAEFDATKAGELEAEVIFRFSQRFGDATTAHETGIFRYTATKPGEDPNIEYIHFRALLLKKLDGWKIVMEYQKAPATEEEWVALDKG